MFSKAALTSIVLGALYVNAIAVPVAREPTPEPDSTWSGETNVSQDLDARAFPLIPALVATLTGISAGAPLIPLLKKPKREAEPETQELEARIIPFLPAIAAGLAGTAVGSFFSRPKREAEPEAQELEARIIPLLPAIVAGLAGTAAGSFISRPKREAEPETQELEARIIPFLPAIVAGLAGTAAGSFFSRPKREVEPDTQELEARLNPLILPGISALAALAPLLPGFPKPKRELSDELFSREPQVDGEQDLDDRAIGLPAITAGLAALSSITPLIPSFVNRPKREASPEPMLSLPNYPKFFRFPQNSNRFGSPILG